MLKTVTFILPGLFEERCQQYLGGIQSSGKKPLAAFLGKSKKRPLMPVKQWLIQQYNLPDNVNNSASLMALAKGLTTLKTDDKEYWLRADPIMLTVGHNGLFCRGNRVLALSEEERTALQSIVNNHYSEQSIELILCDAKQGFVKLIRKPESSFTPLSGVIGNEISQSLPVGSDAAYWHGVLTDLQMLLHNCDVNLQRQEKGLPTINGLWLWAEDDVSPDEIVQGNHEVNIYTDDLSLSGALGREVNLHCLGDNFNNLSSKEESIYSTEMDTDNKAVIKIDNAAFHFNDILKDL